VSSSTRTGALLVFCSGVSFGTLGVFSRHLRDAGLPVPLMLSLRFAGGALVLWVLCFARGEARGLRARQWSGFAVLGCLYFGEAWTYFESANRIPVALTSLLLYLYPAIVAVLGALVWKEKLGRTGALALLLALGGVALAIGNPSGDLQPLGVVLGVATAVIYSAYVLIGAQVQRGVPSTLGSAWVMTTAALIFALATSLSSGWHLPEGRIWADLLGLIVLGTIIPIPMLLSGLARVGPTEGSIISSVEPISAAIFGALLLGEGLGALQLLGGALVLLALVVLALRKR
jgi:drug/metabolite transporter (DMT)-like permease